VLVNLLIAQMSSTFERVKETGHLRWQYTRTQLVREFKDTKSPIPPPLNLLRLVFYDLPHRLWSLLPERFAKRSEKASVCVGFTQEARGGELRAFMKRESTARKNYLDEVRCDDADTIESKVASLQERVDEAEKSACERHESLLALVAGLKVDFERLHSTRGV